MRSPLENLLWLARELGLDSRQLVVPGEGVVSVRATPGRILVSVPEAPLARLAPEEVVECQVDRLGLLFDAPMNDASGNSLRETRVDPSGAMPGIDAVLHSWLLGLEGVHCVAQLHPTACLQVLCSPGVERFVEHRMFPAEVAAYGTQLVYAPYSDPGIPMAREIRSKVSIYLRRSHGVSPRLVLAQNYGLFALGATPEAVLRTAMTVEKAAAVFVGASRLGGPQFLNLQQIMRLEGGRPSEAPRASLIRL